MTVAGVSGTMNTAAAEAGAVTVTGTVAKAGAVAKLDARPNHQDIIAATEHFVRAYFAQPGRSDPSHDYAHVDRVRTTALRLMNEVNREALASAHGTDTVVVLADPLVVEMCALLHDVGDHKYAGGADDECHTAIGSFLDSQNIPADTRSLILRIVDGVSFSGEQRALAEGRVPFSCVELSIVQDADRLDAIGAIGIARCFSFGAVRDRPFYCTANVPLPRDADVGALSAEERALLFVENKTGTLTHFYDKLFIVRDRMKTVAGRRMAEDRHRFMDVFVQQFKSEL